MPTATVDFWFDFASTYSYPAIMRIGAAAEAAGVAVRLRPFLLGPIFKAQGWTTSPFSLYLAKGANMWRDLDRLCGDLGVAFRRPEPFPQNSLLAARVALTGLAEGWGDDFCRAVFRAEFAEGRNIGEPAVLADVLVQLRVDPQAALAAAQSDPIKAKLRAETEEAQALGIFGAPRFITSDGELFWGNDRLERALRWAREGP
ncbi:MAG: 2-hydroxychromene-2-carboxylate isomerase [Xanthobacteraceae bacterium]